MRAESVAGGPSPSPEASLLGFAVIACVVDVRDASVGHARAIEVAAGAAAASTGDAGIASVIS